MATFIVQQGASRLKRRTTLFLLGRYFAHPLGYFPQCTGYLGKEAREECGSLAKEFGLARKEFGLAKLLSK
jgi:hypothetical protein